MGSAQRQVELRAGAAVAAAALVPPLRSSTLDGGRRPEYASADVSTRSRGGKEHCGVRGASIQVPSRREHSFRKPLP